MSEPVPVTTPAAPVPADSGRSSPWPGRFARATLVAALPLILFGGTVTTLRQGMAEDGWLRPDGYLLWLYPLELRLRNVGVFVEHHHREIGSLVGLLAIGLVVATFLGDRRRAARRLALGTLVAICVQGAVGGLRVLENSPDLAFLHGALAHAVFALIGTNAIVASRGFDAARRSEPAPATEALRGATALAALAVYLQIVVGAWLRHSGAPVALGLHLFLAVWAVAEALRGSRAAVRAAAAFGERPGANELARGGRRMRQLVLAQVVLGFAAAVGVYGFSGGFAGRISGFELVFATLHVVGGALLLLQAVGLALWARRLVAPAVSGALAPALGRSGEALR